MKSTKIFGIASIIGNSAFIALSVFMVVDSLRSYMNFKGGEFMAIASGIFLFLAIIGSVLIAGAAITMFALCIMDYKAFKTNKKTLYPIANLIAGVFLILMTIAFLANALKSNNVITLYLCAASFLLIGAMLIYDILRLLNKNTKW